MALPRELAVKLGKPIRLLASGSKGEAFAALCAIARLLEAYGQSFHELADHVETSGLSEEAKQKIGAAIEQARTEGYAEGVKAESKQHGVGDVEIRLIERDLCEVVRISPLEPVPLHVAPASRVEGLVLPDRGIDQVGA